jgi:hypothetical protein
MTVRKSTVVVALAAMLACLSWPALAAADNPKPAAKPTAPGAKKPGAPAGGISPVTVVMAVVAILLFVIFTAKILLDLMRHTAPPPEQPKQPWEELPEHLR